MKATEVPQEESMLEGNRRACYAQDERGRYIVVPSRGWEVEKIVNAQAVDQVRRIVENARDRALSGVASPLEYHMARCQMTVALLAANTGIWRMRVRRHLKPAVFVRLKTELLGRYADALGIDVETLRRVPRSGNLAGDDGGGNGDAPGI